MPEIFFRQLWFSSRPIHIVEIEFIQPLARAGVTAGTLMNRLCQAVRGTVTPLEGLIQRAVVQMLKT